MKTLLALPILGYGRIHDSCNLKMAVYFISDKVTLEKPNFLLFLCLVSLSKMEKFAIEK